MKNELPRLISRHKNLNTKTEIIHSSVAFEKPDGIETEKSKIGNDLYEELKNAISSGDDTLWRMWR